MIRSVPIGNPPSDNPFSTRFTDPGQHQFVFQPGESLAELGRQLIENRFWGELVGPHGSGKSTLLQNLRIWAKENDYRAQYLFLNDQQHRLPLSRFTGSVPRFYLVDGAEQLSLIDWWLLKQWCRLRSCGLVVTTHRNLGLPVLYRTAPANIETLQRVIEVVAGPLEVPPPDEARHLLQQYQGNLRLILFALYDRWEDRM